MASPVQDGIAPICSILAACSFTVGGGGDAVAIFIWVNERHDVNSAKSIAHLGHLGANKREASEEALHNIG